MVTKEVKITSLFVALAIIVLFVGMNTIDSIFLVFVAVIVIGAIIPGILNRYLNT